METNHSGSETAKRLEVLEARLNQHDDRTNMIASDVGSIKASLRSMESSIGQLTNRVHAPTSGTLWVAIATLALTIMVGVSQYIDLRLKPVEADVGAAEKSLIGVHTTLGERAVFIGKVTAELDFILQDLRKNEKLHRGIESRLSGLDADVQVNTSDLKNVRSTLREVDRLGSRRWLEKIDSASRSTAP